MRFSSHALSRARTVLIPKIVLPTSPQHYRPITVNAVVARQLSRVLLHRLEGTVELRGEEWGFIKADGCAENTQVLGAVIRGARCQFKERHVASLDISKAFDTIMHQTLMDILGDLFGLFSMLCGHVDVYRGNNIYPP